MTVITHVQRRSRLAEMVDRPGGVSVGVALAQAQANLGGLRDQACAIIADNSVYCWGANEEGLISQSIQFGAPVFTPTLVEHAPRGTAIAMGESSACVIEMNKKVTCWGAFGNGSSQSTTSPSNLTDIERISLGFMHACALDSAGKAYCWGDNTYGQIGDGTEFSSVEVAIEVSLSP